MCISLQLWADDFLEIDRSTSPRATEFHSLLIVSIRKVTVINILYGKCPCKKSWLYL